MTKKDLATNILWWKLFCDKKLSNQKLWKPLIGHKIFCDKKNLWLNCFMCVTQADIKCADARTASWGQSHFARPRLIKSTTKSMCQANKENFLGQNLLTLIKQFTWGQH